MKLDPVSLRLFVSVLEEGTIAAASEREHIAAAAVSKRLSELEDVLGTPLLVRSNKGVVPTAAGLALMNLARGVLYELDNIATHMREFSSGTRGAVRIFANISVITQFMPTMLKSFLAKHPLVQVSLESMSSAGITKGVAENQADIGIYTQVPHGEQLEIHPFRHDQLVLIVPAGHPLAGRRSVSFVETLDYEFVGLYNGSSLNHQMLKSASELGRFLKLRIQVSGYDALCLMVKTGLGIGILPKACAETYGALDIKIIDLEEPWAHRELLMCVRSYDALSVAAKRLFDHFRSES